MQHAGIDYEQIGHASRQVWDTKQLRAHCGGARCVATVFLQGYDTCFSMPQVICACDVRVLTRQELGTQYCFSKVGVAEIK